MMHGVSQRYAGPPVVVNVEGLAAARGNAANRVTSADRAVSVQVMERRSNPTRRVTSILGLLAAEAPRSLTLSMIAKTLDLSLSTTLGILNELRDAGYVERHEESRGYTLGVGILELGQAARQSKPALGAAREQMVALNQEFGKVCTVATAVGGQVVVLDRVGDAENVGQLAVAGSRYPFDAPVGLMFVAWEGDEAVDAWLARAPIELERSRLRRMRSIINACRQTGYLVERMTEVDVRLHRMLRLVEREPQAISQAFATAAAIFGERDYLLNELSRATHCSVSVICAPVFDADGRPHLILSMYVLDEHVSVRSVKRMAAGLRRGCDVITAVQQGFDPWQSLSHGTG